jgi:hypothetical protein
LPSLAEDFGAEQSCAMLLKRECKEGAAESLSGSQQGLTNGGCSVLKKSKPIPPPLDLTVRNLDQSHEDLVHPSTSPTVQKHLPLRKRALSWSNLGDAPGSDDPFISTSLDLSYPSGTGSSASAVFHPEHVLECDNVVAGSVAPNRYRNPRLEASARASGSDGVAHRASGAPKTATPHLKFSIASLGLEGLLTPASSSSSSQPSSVASSAEALDGHPVSPAKRSSRCFVPSSTASLAQLPLDLSTSPYPYSPLVPAPVWGCFQQGNHLINHSTPFCLIKTHLTDDSCLDQTKGTKIRFGSADEGLWIPAEELSCRVKEEPLTPGGSPSTDPRRCPLLVHKIERITNGSDLTFAIIYFKVSETGPVPSLAAACAIDHPFYVREGGKKSIFRRSECSDSLKLF